MRFSHVTLAALTIASLAACNSDEVVTAERPPLAGVRYIHALADTGAVDIKMIDQLEYSAFALAATFRTGTEHQPTEAKARKIRVFPNSIDPAVTSKHLIDTTLTFQPNVNYTLLLAGSARAGTQRFIVLTDSAPTPDSLNIAVRTVHAAPGVGNIDAYYADTTTSARPATPAAAGLAPFAVSPYVTRRAGSLHVRVAGAGLATNLATALAPAGTAGTNTVNPVAGSRIGGTAMSAFVFPASVTGSAAPQGGAFTSPAVVYFMDRIPTTVR